MKRLLLLLLPTMLLATPAQVIIIRHGETPESTTITLQLKGEGVVDYYEGLETKPLQKGTLSLYAQNTVRKQLMDKRNRIIRQHGSDSDYTVLIEPGIKTSYKEMIDVLDEMQILAIGKYALVDAKQQK